MNESIEEYKGNHSSNAEIPLQLDPFRSTYHVLLAALGVPLNLLIYYIIICPFKFMEDIVEWRLYFTNHSITLLKKYVDLFYFFSFE